MKGRIHYREAGLNTDDAVSLGHGLLNDNRLSLNARGVFAQMAASTDMDDMRAHSAETVAEIESALVELERYGYLLRWTDDTTGETVYDLTSSPDGIYAVTWALAAPVDTLEERAVLLAYAYHADVEGKASHPTMDELAQMTVCMEQEIIAAREALVRRGLLTPGNPAVVAHLPAEQRPAVYDLMYDGGRGR